MPWGHIAGKEWGDPNGKHVLALHGRSIVHVHYYVYTSVHV